jgi:hypothetical protein
MNDDYIEILKAKDNEIQKLIEEIKNNKSTLRGLENTTTYFKKKVEELTK